MGTLLKWMAAFANFMWQGPVLIVLVGIGLFFTVLFRGNYLLKWGFHWKNTFGSISKKYEGKGIVSAWQMTCAALSNTIGTGNVAGVSTAIVMGGPGALFWIWVTAALGFSSKAAEIIIGTRYRTRFENTDEYVCDRSFALRNACGHKIAPAILSVLVAILMPFTNMVQNDAIVSAFAEAFGTPSVAVTAVVTISCLAIILGGLRRIAASMEKVVPVMVIVYFIGMIALYIAHAERIIPAIVSVFQCAFSPAAAVGGFAGATVREAMRYGVARAMFSNGSGAGYSYVWYAPAKSDHLVRLASWGWGTNIVDTLVCTISGLAILISEVYITRPDASSSAYVTVAFTETFGKVGGWFIAIAVGIFAWTSIIGGFYSTEKSIKFLLGDNKNTKIISTVYCFLFMAPAALFNGFDATLLWNAADLVNIAFVFVSAYILLRKYKEILRLFNDFTQRYIPALERGENPEPVAYETTYAGHSLFGKK